MPGNYILQIIVWKFPQNSGVLCSPGLQSLEFGVPLWHQIGDPSDYGQTQYQDKIDIKLIVCLTEIINQKCVKQFDEPCRPNSLAKTNFSCLILSN